MEVIAKVRAEAVREARDNITYAVILSERPDGKKGKNLDKV